MLSREDVEVFAEVIKKEYRKQLTYEEAEKIANGLVDYFSFLGKLYDRIKDKNN